VTTIEHRVLIVAKKNSVDNGAENILKKARIKYVTVTSGEEGVLLMKKASRPFSAILADLHLPDMTGSSLLETARSTSKDTLRYLTGDEADINAVTEAINRGAIHRYIAKPFHHVEFLETIKKGLEQFELTMENQHLFKLAQAQSENLYSLNMNLKKRSSKHKKALILEEQKIKEMSRVLEKGFESRSHIKVIEKLVQKHKMLDTSSLKLLCSAVLAELDEQFRDLAVRNGIEMKVVN